MKGLPRRLFFYLIGISLGIVLTVFYLRGKYEGDIPEYCYLPNCRVKKELRSKPLVNAIDTKESCVPEKGVIDEILTEGKVLFRESDPRKEPCGEYEIRYNDYRIRLKNCRDTVYLLGAACR